jgi:hypothetical protein
MRTEIYVYCVLPSLRGQVAGEFSRLPSVGEFVAVRGDVYRVDQVLQVMNGSNWIWLERPDEYVVVPEKLA